MITMRTQQGATLLVALIMLVLLTLFALSAFNTSTGNLKAVGNMQARTEATNVAQQAIETAISTPLFSTSPANAIAAACGAANTLCADAAGNLITNPADSSKVYTITLTPQPACVLVRAIKTAELYEPLVNGEAWAKDCGVSLKPGSAGYGGMTGSSLCANSVWNVTAQAVAPSSGARATVTQGVGILIRTADMATSCGT